MKRLLLRTHGLLLRVFGPRTLLSLHEADIRELFRTLLEEAEHRGRRAMLRVWWVEVRQLGGYMRALSSGQERGRLLAWADTLGSARSEVRAASWALWRRPIHAVGVIATLAVGLGLTGSVVATARVSVLSPLPVPDADRLVVLSGHITSARWTGRTGISAVELEHAAVESPAVERFAAFSLAGEVAMAADGPARSGRVRFVSASYFETLGLDPAMGRGFSTKAPSERSVVLAHHTWLRHFGSDPAVLGRTFELAGVSYDVIGVMPPEFQGLSRSLEPFDAWALLQPSEHILGFGASTSVGFASFWGVARLAPDVTIQEAEEQLRAAHARFVAERPIDQPRTVTALSLRDYYFGDARAVFVAVFLGALTILIVCALNVVFLTVVRLEQRASELRIRVVLGAARERIVQTMLVEAALLGCVGGVLAAVFASTAPHVAGPTLGVPMMHFGVPDFGARDVGSMMLAATVVTASATLLCLGVTRRGERSRRAHTSRGGPSRTLALSVVSTEAAVSTVVLVALVLGLSSLREARTVELGYRADGLYSVRLNLMGTRHESGDGPASFARELSDAVASTAGSQVAVMGPDMMGRSLTHVNAVKEGADSGNTEEFFRLQWISMTPGSFATLGVDVVEGRDLRWSDDRDAPRVAVVSQRTADLLWPGVGAVGQRLVLPGFSTLVEVVGVVPNAKHVSRLATPYAVGDAYFPLNQLPTPRLSLLYRAAGEPPPLAVIEELAQEVDPGVVLYDPSQMSDRIAGELSALRLVIGLSTAYGAIGLALSLCAIVTLVASFVHFRRRETAIRAALGARLTSLVWDVTRPTFVAVVVGVFAGSIVAVGVLERVLSPLLFRVSPLDPLSYAVVGATIVGAGLAASAIPAMRAASGGSEELAGPH
ncbi:MAG: ABC transporter permease [Gemmatimonadota bacterium]